MLVICSHCQRCYSFPEDCAEAEFACSRCHQPLRIAHSHAAFTDHAHAVPLQPMQRSDVHLWRWFMLILLLVACAGFLLQRDAWMDNRWFRSSLMRVGIDLPARSKDWRIEPESIKPQWITREDGSRILLIHGSIENLLAIDMPLPRLMVTFFSAGQPDRALSTSVAHFIRLPQQDHLHGSGLLNPALDLSTVPANSRHAFVILMQHIPEKTADFTLLPTMQAASDPAPR